MSEKQNKKCSKCGKPLLNPETQNLGECADCLGKHEVIHFDIDFQQLMNHVPNIKPPEEIWKTKSEMSEDYLKLLHRLSVLTIYLAQNINEGPEVKDNMNKRLILARIIIGMLLENLAVTAYDVYGILTEVTHDIFMNVNGRSHIIQTIAQMRAMEEEVRRKKSGQYMT